MTPQTFTSAPDDLKPHKRMKDAYTDKELAKRVGLFIGNVYMVGNKVVTINALDVNGAERGPNGKWRCRTKSARALMKRATGVLTFYDAQPVGGGVIHVDEDEGTTRRFDIEKWNEFKEENNLYKLDRRRDDVFEMVGSDM